MSIQTIEIFKEETLLHLEAIESFVNRMPYNGDICADSQKVCLTKAIKNLEYVLDATTQDDLSLGEF